MALPSWLSLKLKVGLCLTCLHVESREPSLSSHSMYDSSGETQSVSLIPLASTFVQNAIIDVAVTLAQ